MKKYIGNIDKRADDGFYFAGWCAIAVVVLVMILKRVVGFNVLRLLGPCMFHLLTGYHCPGCGGTRAVYALLRGEIWRSFCYHPFVLYVAAIGSWFMISQTIERVSRGRIKIGLHFREIYMWIALGIIIVNFLVKNAVLLIWNIDFLA